MAAIQSRCAATSPKAKRITSELLRELGQVAAIARKLPNSDGRIAVLGHSMASDIVVRFAQANPDVQATVAVSVFSPVVTTTSPRNLLVIVGALEPSMLKDEGLRIVNLRARGAAVAGETYGNFAEGTARRLALARGVEHIGVLYSRDSLEQSLRWMNETFGRQQTGFIDSRGIWLALLFFGIIALAWPLSALLPVASKTPAGADLAWKPLLVAAFMPAILTPLILWKMPTDFLPILLGDYLALHFLLYGVLTITLMHYLRDPSCKPAMTAISSKAAATAAIAVAAYNIVAFGLPIDTYLFSFLPIPTRIPLIAAIACGTLLYFIADEWLTRGAGARRGANQILLLAVACHRRGDQSDEAILPCHHCPRNPDAVPRLRTDQPLELQGHASSATGRIGQCRRFRVGDRGDVSDDRAMSVAEGAFC